MYLAIIVLPLLGSIISGFFGRKVGVNGAQLIRLFNLLKCTLNSPPKPHAFVNTTLLSKISPINSTTLSKNVAVETGIKSKETLFKDKILENTPRLANDKEIIKNVFLKKIHEETFFENKILESTYELRSGEILEKESSTCDLPSQDKFTACPTEPSMTEISSIEPQATEISSIELQALEKMAHLTRILEDLDESDSLLDQKEIMSVMLEISDLWWFLFILSMLILGLLTVIIYLLNKAKIKYLSKLSTNVKYISLTKSLAFLSLECKKIKISIKSLYSIKRVEILKNAINTMNDAIDFYKVIKYIANKFYYLSKKLVLTSNRMTFSDLLNYDLLDKARSLEKRHLIIKNMARYNSNITVYMYTMNESGRFDMSFVERHIRFNFNQQNNARDVLNIPRYMDYLAQTNLLLDLMFSYASIRDIAYAYQYILEYSTNSRLNSDKVRLYNVHKLMSLARELGDVYPNNASPFNLPYLIEKIRTYEISLDEQWMNVEARYECLEEIISTMENIIKILCPPHVTLEFMFIGTVNTSKREVEQYYFEHYRNHAG